MTFAHLALTEPAEAMRRAGVDSVDVAVVAGSGFTGLRRVLGEPQEFHYAELPNMPVSGVAGHPGRLIIGTFGSTRVALFEGRVHLYEGFSALDAAFAPRLAAALGAHAIVLTNASGAVDAELQPGELALIGDSLNLTAQSPLEGWMPGGGASPFVSMTDAWDAHARALAREVADEIGVALCDGCVYAQVPGPQFETPAEVEMLRRLGADLVGMSTVVEAIAARALGLRVLGISLVANRAGVAGLSHAEVLDAGRAASASSEALVAGILQRL